MYSRSSRLALGMALLAGTAQAALVMWDLDVLESKRVAWKAGATDAVSAVEALLEEASAALTAGPYSVTFKEETPPSGDKRDYMSQGPYWWPNPDTGDGLPYIRRDGVRNPEGDALDRQPMSRMASSAVTLALAYFFTGEERYAAHGALLLRTWFLSGETGMNPHLEYGQRIPGRTPGRGIGIIDSPSLMPVGDAATLFLPSDAWTEEDHEALRGWFRAYNAWLLESDHGRDEARQHNNHGTWYDAQVVAYALFSGNADLAREILLGSVKQRIAAHIEPDGRQPHELGRTLPSGYSQFNLIGFVELAAMAERIGIDLWRYETEDGRGIRKALDYLVPYASGAREWTYEDLADPDWKRLAPVLRRAAIVYGNPEYESVLQRLLGGEAPRHRINLIVPAP